MIKGILPDKVYWGMHPSGKGHYTPTIDLEPIPLTPKILERCGFEDQSDNVEGLYWVKRYLLTENRGLKAIFIWNLAPEGSNHPDYTAEDSRVKIKYLHQLQNLFFALSSNELSFSE